MFEEDIGYNLNADLSPVVVSLSFMVHNVSAQSLHVSLIEGVEFLLCDKFWVVDIFLDAVQGDL